MWYPTIHPTLPLLNLWALLLARRTRGYRLESVAFAPLIYRRTAIQLTAAHNAGASAFIKCQQMMPPFNFADSDAVMGSKVGVVS